MAWATIQTPSLSGTQDGRISLRTLVPFDFKGKLEKGNSKSISPKKVRFPLDKDRASQVSAHAGTETAPHRRHL